ncbi:hypothetical protein OS175_02520 [Marinicella sp. S1101]|uniref:hypothetical protein n=1 Tax=Marinicella marina TaxID=2996016 RepID=UPI002260978B|nr:hypothetical protein [Marinicella marina]MCX7552741.1 hypothetical protein [Marinicella marina]MDJ1139950.1 hypothetical protein [Marinicella marina]
MKYSILTKSIALLLFIAFINPVVAQVNTCQALSFYGNAVNEGLCKGLSPGNQNLWVCDLTGGSPDIHTTFNAVTNLHLTVRNNPAPPQCQGSSQLTGVWPAGLNIMAGQPNMVCGVSVQNYVDRFNAVNQAAVIPGHSLCESGFLNAQANLRLTPAQTHLYLLNCAANHCP